MFLKKIKARLARSTLRFAIKNFLYHACRTVCGAVFGVCNVYLRQGALQYGLCLFANGVEMRKNAAREGEFPRLQVCFFPKRNRQ